MKTLVLFLTIFLAVFLANVASHFATAALVVAGIGQVVDDLKEEISKPNQQYSSALSNDIQRLKSSQKAEIEHRTNEQQRAFEK